MVDYEDWINFNGYDSNDYDLAISKLPLFQKPSERVETVEIPGRDGTLYLTNDTFASYSAECELTMMDDTQRTTIFAWLRGSGLLITSDDPTHAVRARVVNKIEPVYIAPAIKDILVIFEIQPFIYEAVPTVTEFTASGTLTTNGTRWSLPIIVVTGTGTLTINGYVLVITETGVTINSEIQECYIGTTSKNDKVTGDFPILAAGANTITLGAGITKVVITDNRRWY